MIALKHAAAAISALTALSVSFALASEPEEFAYLAANGGTLTVLHTLSMSFSADESYTLSGPRHRTAEFNEVPFEISLAAYLQDDRAIMVHAEHVADLSGAANYDRFPVTDWPAPGFRGEGQRCHEIPAEIVEGEHDLKWLRDHGLEPSGPVWMEQHFLSGNEYNDEVVISLILKSDTCENSAEAGTSFQAMRDGLQVSPGRN